MSGRLPIRGETCVVGCLAIVAAGLLLDTILRLLGLW